MKLMSKAHFTGNAIEHSNVIFGNLEAIIEKKMDKNLSVIANSTFLITNIVD